MQISTHLTVASSLRAVSLGAKPPRRRRPPFDARHRTGRRIPPSQTLQDQPGPLDRSGRCERIDMEGRAAPSKPSAGQRGRWIAARVAGPMSSARSAAKRSTGAFPGSCLTWTRSGRLAGRDSASATVLSHAPGRGATDVASGLLGRRHGACRLAAIRTAVQPGSRSAGQGRVRRMSRIAARPVRPALPAAWGASGGPDRAAGSSCRDRCLRRAMLYRRPTAFGYPGTTDATLGRRACAVWEREGRRAADRGRDMAARRVRRRGELRAPLPWHDRDE